MLSTDLVLLSNDDGYSSPGLAALESAFARHARTVVVAPETEQSATSHSLSLHRPLRMRSVREGVFAIDGTPADCVYVALHATPLDVHGPTGEVDPKRVLIPKLPRIVVSGINLGLNLGQDVFYSGTVAAAREGALRGVPSMAVSMGMSSGARFEPAAEVAARLALRLLAATRPAGLAPLLNVNFPAGRTSYEGVRATRLGRRNYDETVVLRHDPRGHEYFWIGGPNAYHERVEGSDTDAVDDGFVSVSPLVLDATAPDHLGLAAFVAGDGALP